MAVEREHDAADLDLVAGDHQAPLSSVEGHVADGTVRADGDQRDLADLGVLVVDAGNVDTYVTRFGTPDREDARAELDAARLAERPSRRNDQMHALRSLARSSVRQ